MVHKINPVDGLSPLGIKRRLPWKPVVTGLLLLSLVGLLPWWHDPKKESGHDSEPGRTTALNGTNDSARLDTTKPITEVNVALKWRAKVDLDLVALYTAMNGDTGLVDYTEKSAPGIELDNDAGIDEAGGKNEEKITITDLDRYKEIWFGTFLFTPRGTYNDYDGRIVLHTNNGEDVEVPLTSTEHKRYLLIAKLTNGPEGPVFSSVNRAADCEDVGPTTGTNLKCTPIEPKMGG